VLSQLLLIASGVLIAGDSPWLDVPYVRQESAGCGAASIAMVMQYWVKHCSGVDPAAAVGDFIYSKFAPVPSKGISGKNLQKYLAGHGFQAFIASGEISDVRNHLGKGRPLIACLAPSKLFPYLHYVVLAGMTDSVVYFHEPARGKLMQLGLDRFQREWKPPGNWMLLAVPAVPKEVQ